MKSLKKISLTIADWKNIFYSKRADGWTWEVNVADLRSTSGTAILVDIRISFRK